MMFMMGLGCMVAAIALAMWFGREPLKPATLVRPECTDCHQRLTDYYFNVLRCDKCLLAYINRLDEGELKADGALSVTELERMWAL